MLQVVLRNYGIESRLDNENAAMLTVGMPIPAVPIIILVEDDRAEEAAKIVADELRKRGPSTPTAIHVQVRCACGRTLEYPKGEEPPDECPYCGRSLEDNAAPAAAHAPKSSKKSAAFAFGIILLISAGFMVFRNTTGSPALQERTGWNERLRKKLEAIPAVEVPKVDADAIVAPLQKDFPEDSLRFSTALDKASSVDALILQWNGLSVELSPDWAMEHGFADSPRLSRYSIRADRKQILLNALALQKLRRIQSGPPSLDGRLFERYLERILLSHQIFGSRLADPRPAAWGVLACVHVLDRPVLLAERLEQVPDVVREILEDLRDVPTLWFEPAFTDLNRAMAVLGEIDRGLPEERLKTAVRMARETLEDYRTKLRKLQKSAPRNAPVDPRWITFLLRDMEFSGRTPRETALKMLDAAERAQPVWASLGERPRPAASSYSFDEWRLELEKLTARARDLTLQHRFAELPPGDLPTSRLSPFPDRGSAEWPGYGARTFETPLRAFLWISPWEKAGAREQCAADVAQIALMGETIPGRHLQTLLARRDAGLIRRLYWSHSTSEGWVEYCRRWALTIAPAGGYDLKYSEGFRFVAGWCNAVELGCLSGSLTESEAIQFLQGGLGYSEDQAQDVIGWATLAPLYHAGQWLGEEDLTRLRETVAGKMGKDFDLAQFHTRVLGYAHTPVALIREEMLRDPK
jgi:hypothetical protein